MDEWLSEVGGGLHCKRKMFLSLRERIEKRKIAHLPIARRDRPTRFSFDRFKPVAQQHGCTNTVVNQESPSPQEEMVEDLMAVVPTFSCRLYGLRPYRKQIRDVAHHG